MAIRTQQAKVFEPIVFVVSVDVVEFERNRLIQPALQATADADRCQHTVFEKAVLELVRLNGSGALEIPLQRCSGRKLPITIPCSAEEMRCIDSKLFEPGPKYVVIATIRRDA